MSRDIQLGFNCPHIIGEEPVVLGADRRSLYTSKPISGQSLIQVVCNNLYTVSPYTGLVSRAAVTSYRREPFKITAANRTLTILSQVGTIPVTLAIGYLSAAQVVATLTTAASRYVSTTASTTGYLTITDAGNPGAASRVQLSGLALEALGFDQQSGARGKVVVPPWRLYSRRAVNPQDAVDSLGYYVGFDIPVSSGMYFTVTYPVAPNHCLRCLTTEVENDYRFDAQGATLMVENENLLYQSCLKVLLTDLRSNIYFPWYGSALNSQIGSKVVGSTQSGLRQAASNALTMFQNLQTAQAKYQRLTAKERLFSIDNIDVLPSPDDPTVYLIDVGVRNYSNEPVEISIVYTAPGTFALPGTNQLSMGNY